VPAHIGRLLRSFIRCCLDWSRDGAPSEGTGCANGVTMAAPAETATGTVSETPGTTWQDSSSAAAAPPPDGT
ncbi:MAG: hypothetical protein GX595_01605, partial [Lentisphaerae bacterium]|nr:hypothetical protein [Lentisphaerota bacterium]